MDRRLTWWLAWLLCFYFVWALLLIGGNMVDKALSHWPVAVAMTVGSYIAGSTPMGGGTVGFPVLVLFFDAPAALGRNFGLTIQSAGMTSASLFILCRRVPLAVSLLRHGIPGAAVGLLVGTFAVIPLVSDAVVKLAFACLWCSFGVLTLLKNEEFCRLDTKPVIPEDSARRVGWLVGLAGGITTSLTGVGVDMMLFTVLVLLYRADLKVAVPSSVVIMAAASLMGTALHGVLGNLSQEVYYNWLAAAPVVVLGAPLGALLVTRISRRKTLNFVALLCLGQFFWTLHRVPLTFALWIFVGLSLLVASLGFFVLYRTGHAE